MNFRSTGTFEWNTGGASFPSHGSILAQHFAYFVISPQPGWRAIFAQRVSLLFFPSSSSSHGGHLQCTIFPQHMPIDRPILYRLDVKLSGKRPKCCRARSAYTRQRSHDQRSYVHIKNVLHDVSYVWIDPLCRMASGSSAEGKFGENGALLAFQPSFLKFFIHLEAYPLGGFLKISLSIDNKRIVRDESSGHQRYWRHCDRTTYEWRLQFECGGHVIALIDFIDFIVHRFILLKNEILNNRGLMAFNLYYSIPRFS